MMGPKKVRRGRRGRKQRDNSMTWVCSYVCLLVRTDSNEEEVGLLVPGRRLALDMNEVMRESILGCDSRQLCS